jgi:PAS domain-containing protein
MSSFVQTVRKQRSSTRNQSTRNQTADAREGLPDIAEAEAVLLDLARVFSDPATGRAYVLDDLAEEGKEPAADVHAPNLEAKYRALLEQIPAVVFMAYLDRGISEAYVSPQIEASLGYSREEWLKDPVRWYQHIHPMISSAGVWKPPRCFFRASHCDPHIGSLRAMAALSGFIATPR